MLYCFPHPGQTWPPSADRSSSLSEHVGTYLDGSRAGRAVDDQLGQLWLLRGSPPRLWLGAHGAHLTHPYHEYSDGSGSDGGRPEDGGHADAGCERPDDSQADGFGGGV